MKNETQKIEAYGVKGLKNTQWRKVFKNEKAMTTWAEQHDADIHGIRNVDEN